MRMILKYKGYYSSVLRCDNGELYGEVLGLRHEHFNYFGNSILDLRQRFVDKVNEYLYLCEVNYQTPEQADSVLVQKDFDAKHKPITNRGSK